VLSSSAEFKWLFGTRRAPLCYRIFFLWYIQFEDEEVAMPIVITHSGLLEIHSDSSCKALRLPTPEASLPAL